MTISPAISWAQKDVDMKLGPPIKISIRPRVNVLSTSDSISRCSISTVSVDSNVTVDETDFTLDAFGIPIWNVKIMNKLARKFKMLESKLMHRCKADCHGLFERKNTLTMEQACGNPSGKVLISKGYDESDPISKVTPFHEARAAEVSLSEPVASSHFQPEEDDRLLQRFSELAVCSKFGQVERKGHSLSICVEKVIKPTVRKRSLLSRKRRSGHVDHGDVENTLREIGHALDEVKSSLSDPSSLALHNTYPPTKSLEQACGDFTGAVSQDDPERFKRLVEYPLDDVVFLPEGPVDSWCGVETRKCGDCDTASTDVEDYWSWCGSRTMSMRLAIRLKRLAVLTAGQVVVERSLSMNSSGDSSKLYKEGRAVNISLIAGSSLTVQELTSKAILAGFDSVRYSSPNYIEVCTKIQDGLQAHIVQFPEANLIGVPLPLGEEVEYEYPSQLIHESRKPLLFDSYTSANNIGERFKLEHFVSPGKRFIRLDPLLLDTLELAYDEFKGGFYVVPGSGYRPRSVNIDNIDTRHPDEILRYQMGQAVEVKPNSATNTESLFKLAVALIKVAKSVRVQRISVGIGCKADRLYFELRPMQDDDDRAVQVWQSHDSAGVLYRRLKGIEDMIAKGGTVLSAREDHVICNKTVLGDQYFYFNFDLDQDGYCWSDKDDFCVASQESRYNISQVLQRRLTSAAGSGKLPRPDIMPEIEECVINTCGGCPSAGTVWKEKVIACTSMVLKYLSRASVPFQPLKDKVSIFNTENHESGVHSQACHDTNICVENTQIYSLLMPLITATFKQGNTDELLFGGADNPSPLLEIVEQELAWRAEGKVNVFVETAKDINAMRNVIKILMVLNKNVTDVTFHIDPDADEDDVIITLQRKVEQWSGSMCPTWSRLVTTPYEVYRIPAERKRRSLERSKDRNKTKFEMKNWEVDWVLKS